MNHLLQQKNAGCAGLIFPLLSGQHQGLGASQVGGYPEMQQHSPWASPSKRPLGADLHHATQGPTASNLLVINLEGEK